MLSAVAKLLTRRDWIALSVLLVLTVVLSVTEMASIAGMGMFFSVAVDPKQIDTMPYVSDIFAHFDISSESARIFAVLAFIIAIVLFRNLLSFVLLISRLRFLHGMKRDLSCNLLQAYMAKPYTFFLENNSSKISRSVLFETNDFVNKFIFSWISIFSDGLMLLSIAVVLFYIDPMVALIAAAVAGSLGLLIIYALRNVMRRLGVLTRSRLEAMVRTSNELVLGIKEIKVVGQEQHFISRFRDAAAEYARACIRFMVLSDGPRFALEVFAVLGFGAIFVTLVMGEQNIAGVAATLGAFAFAIYRLLPVTHRMISSFGGIHFNTAIVENMIEILEGHRSAANVVAEEPLPFDRQITFTNVSYSYPGRTAIDDVSLAIRSNESVGIVGASGAGKTTLVDILIGLLEPGEGTLAVDGRPISVGDLPKWRRNVGYVPQAIHVLDDTIERNVAIGIWDSEVDQARVWQALQMADLSDFVRSLPEGLSTTLGERGTRLSGGQRQRIGIARAMYREAKLLVLDEATSAVDYRTEATIRESIDSLRGKVTQVIVAHRIQTVQGCDRIIMMDGGRIVAEGSYAALARDNARFRDLVTAGGG